MASQTEEMARAMTPAGTESFTAAAMMATPRGSLIKTHSAKVMLHMVQAATEVNAAMAGAGETKVEDGAPAAGQGGPTNFTWSPDEARASACLHKAAWFIPLAEAVKNPLTTLAAIKLLCASLPSETPMQRRRTGALWNDLPASVHDAVVDATIWATVNDFDMAAPLLSIIAATLVAAEYSCNGLIHQLLAVDDGVPEPIALQVSQLLLGEDETAVCHSVPRCAVGHVAAAAVGWYTNSSTSRKTLTLQVLSRVIAHVDTAKYVASDVQTKLHKQICSIISDGLTSSEKELLVAALEAVETACQFWYSSLGKELPVWLKAAAALTKAADTELQIAAFSVCATVAEEENEMVEEGKYCAKFCTFLVPEIPRLLTLCAESHDPDDTLNVAAQCCAIVPYVARVVGDAAIAHIVAYVPSALSSKKCQQRDSGAVVLGITVEVGCTASAWRTMAGNAVPVLLALINSDTEQRRVVDSAFFALAQLVKEPSLASVVPVSPPIIDASLAAFARDRTDSARPDSTRSDVWRQASSLLHNLLTTDYGGDDETRQLVVDVWPTTVETVVSQIETGSLGEHIESATTVITDSIRAGLPPQVLSPFIPRLCSVLLKRGEASCAAAPSPVSQHQVVAVSAILQIYIMALHSNEACQQCVDSCLHVLETVADVSTEELEEMYMLVGTVVQDCDNMSIIAKAWPRVRTVAVRDLDRVSSDVVIGVIGDVSRSLGKSAVVGSEKLLTDMLTKVNGKSLFTRLQVLTCFSDMAMAGEEHAMAIAMGALPMLEEVVTSYMCALHSSELWADAGEDYTDEAQDRNWTMLFESVTGFVQSSVHIVRVEGGRAVAKKIAATAGALVSSPPKPSDMSDQNLSLFAGVMGDFATNFGGSCLTIPQVQRMGGWLAAARQRGDSDAVSWAIAQLQALYAAKQATDRVPQPQPQPQRQTPVAAKPPKPPQKA